MWKCSVPKVPWNCGCIFLIKQCFKGWLSSLAITKAYWIPQVTELEWMWSEAVKTHTSSLSRGSSMDWETGRGSAIFCLLFGRTWQLLSREREEGLWEWGLGWEAEVSFGKSGGRLHVRGERRRQETSIKLFISWIVSKAGTDNCVFTKQKRMRQASEPSFRHVQCSRRSEYSFFFGQVGFRKLRVETEYEFF